MQGVVTPVLEERLAHLAQRFFHGGGDGHTLTDVAAVRCHVPRGAEFAGAVLAGQLEELRMVRVRAGSCRLERRHVQARPNAHKLLVVLSGEIVVQSRAAAVNARPCEVLLYKDDGCETVTLTRPSEFLVLEIPISDRVCMARFAGGAVERLPSGGEATRILATWLRDAMLLEDALASTDLSRSVARVIADLARLVINQPSSPGRHRRDRALIELVIGHDIENGQLSIAGIADRLGCSVRTLHRVFGKGGGESLERFVQRKRVERCAALLRDPVQAWSLSLTELALQFGFANSSHFCKVFRAHMGMPPSKYRDTSGAGG